MTAEQSTIKEGKPDDDVALSRIREEIEARAQRKADELLEEADQKAKNIIDEARNEAKKIKQKIYNETKSEAEKIKVREVSRKKLSIKMDYLQTRESMIDEIYVQAKSELQKFTKSNEYSDFLEDLVKSTALSIGGGELNLHIRTEDKSLLNQDTLDKIAKEVQQATGERTSITVEDSTLDALGGIKMFRSDNNLFVDNTFEARLQRSSEETRVGLLELLS